MSDSEDEVFLSQNSFAGSLECGDSFSALLQEDVPCLEADGSYLDVGEAVSNLFCFNNNSNSSALPLPFECQGSCGDLEGTVEAEIPFPRVKKGIKPAVKRGIEALIDKELAERNSDRIPPNTKKATSWAVRVWNEWSAERNSLPISSRQEDEFVVAPVAEILHTVCDYELCFWLSKFVHEIRKQDGTYYPPNTLYQICFGVQRYLRQNGFAGLNIFQDSQYKAFQDSLDARAKNLTPSRIGITVKQAKPILEDEEEILWSKGLLGDSDPKTLVNTLVFLIGKYFALRSGEEHKSLPFAQLEVVKGDETQRSRLRYSSFGEKNFGGGVQHR